MVIAVRPASNKDPAIVAVLAKLSRDLGAQAFEVIDHWDADPTAIGIARTAEPRRLAYITADTTSGHFFLELESPGATQDPTDYVVAGRWDSVEYEELRAQVAKHLGIGGAV